MKNLVDLVTLLSQNESFNYVEDKTNNILVITGNLEEYKGIRGIVEIRLTFGVAPSLQSMLSRRCQVTVSAQVFIGGDFAGYTSDLDSETETQIGSILSGISQHESYIKETAAKERLNFYLGEEFTFNGHPSTKSPPLSFGAILKGITSDSPEVCTTGTERKHPRKTIISE